MEGSELQGGEPRGGELRRVPFVVALLVLAGVALYVVVTAIAGSDVTRLDALVLLAVSALAGLGALLGWRARADAAREIELRRREVEQRLAEREATLEATRTEVGAALEREAGLERARQEWEEAAAERETALESTRQELEEVERERGQEVERERAERQAVELGRATQKEHARRLSGELARMRRERGPLADPSDVPTLVLRVATTLLEAEKGLLLSRRDEDADGGLDLVTAYGFERDPRESRLVRRFADQVIERDTTIREDAPAAPSDAGGTADEEIDNLVAIPIYVRDDFSGVVICANKPGGFAEHDDDVLLALGDHAGAVLDNAHLHGRLRTAYLSTVALLAEALEAKDPFLRGHSDEVSDYVQAVAEQLDLEPDRREQLVFASLLHDVGKIGVSERILLKPSALTPEERSIIQLHPRIGCRLIEQVPALRPMALAILHHHERFDGGGYPAGLKGEQIPIEARIICVADSFSAMTAERPYRGRMSFDDACEELKRCAGTQFDPTIVRAFVDAVRRRPPGGEQSPLASALSDPELRLRRSEDEPLLGFGSFAVTDNLTLLYSHSYFHDVAQAEADRAAIQESPFAVVLVELGGIAELNRDRGYGAGDAAIRAAARAVQRAAVRCGGTACRYGGRRLGLIAPNVDADGAARIAEELVEDIQGDGEAPVLTGVAVWREGDDGHDVVRRARAALASEHGDGSSAPAAARRSARRTGPRWLKPLR